MIEVKEDIQSPVEDNSVNENENSSRIEYDLNSNVNTEESNNPEEVHKKKKKHIIIFLIILAVALGIAGFFLYTMFLPIVNYIGDTKVTVEVGEQYIDKGINAYTKFKSINDKVIIDGAVDTSKIGEYKITYKVPFLSKYKEYYRTVSVVDKEKPVINLNGDQSCIISYGTEFVDPGYTASDNYDGDITEKVEVSKKEISESEYDLIYKVQDSSGNKFKITRNVKIVDDQKPDISLNGYSVVSVILGTEYNENGATAIDNKDGDISDKITTTGDVDVSKEGTYNIVYSIKDSSGNEASIERKVIVSTKEKAGIIYLTFDDGPSASITPQILDILKEKGVKATFFVLNYSDENEELIKREYEEGNAIGIHGYSHQYSEIYTSADACYENITRLQDKLKNSIGVEVKILRFPGGSSNTISKNYCEGVMTEISNRVLSEGFKYYDWNVSSGDAGDTKTKEGVYNNVTSGLQQGRHNVVLMHDFGGNTKTLEALPEIIDFGLENGYLFDVITTDTPMVAHTIQN